MRRRCSGGTSAESLVGSVRSSGWALLLRLRLRREERRGQPCKEVLRLHEPPGIRPRAQDDDGDLLVALGQTQQRRQAVAGLRDEAGLPRQDVDVLAAQEMIRAVERESAPRGA